MAAGAGAAANITLMDKLDFGEEGQLPYGHQVPCVKKGSSRHPLPPSLMDLIGGREVWRGSAGDREEWRSAVDQTSWEVITDALHQAEEKCDINPGSCNVIPGFCDEPRNKDLKCCLKDLVQVWDGREVKHLTRKDASLIECTEPYKGKGHEGCLSSSGKCITGELPNWEGINDKWINLGVRYFAADYQSCSETKPGYILWKNGEWMGDGVFPCDKFQEAISGYKMIKNENLEGLDKDAISRLRREKRKQQITLDLITGNIQQAEEKCDIIPSSCNNIPGFCDNPDHTFLDCCSGDIVYKANDRHYSLDEAKDIKCTENQNNCLKSKDNECAITSYPGIENSIFDWAPKPKKNFKEYQMSDIKKCVTAEEGHYVNPDGIVHKCKTMNKILAGSDIWSVGEALQPQELAARTAALEYLDKTISEADKSCNLIGKCTNINDENGVPICNKKPYVDLECCSDVVVFEGEPHRTAITVEEAENMECTKPYTGLGDEGCAKDGAPGCFTNILPETQRPLLKGVGQVAGSQNDFQYCEKAKEGYILIDPGPNPHETQGVGPLARAGFAVLGKEDPTGLPPATRPKAAIPIKCDSIHKSFKDLAAINEGIREEGWAARAEEKLTWRGWKAVMRDIKDKQRARGFPRFNPEDREHLWAFSSSTADRRRNLNESCSEITTTCKDITGFCEDPDNEDMYCCLYPPTVWFMSFFSGWFSDDEGFTNQSTFNKRCILLIIILVVFIIFKKEIFG